MRIASYSSARLAFLFMMKLTQPWIQRLCAASLCYRSSKPAPGKDVLHYAAVSNNRNSVYQQELYSFRMEQRLFVCRAIDHTQRIKNGNIRVSANANPPFVSENGRTLFQTLRRHERHLF